MRCDIVSSDHSPFRFADPKGKRIAGTNAGFHKVPNGVPEARPACRCSTPKAS